MLSVCVVVFFFKQKTAYEVLISDGSSDVCSSDLFAYTTLLRLNVVVAAVRQRLGLPYWSLSKHAKSKVKNAVAFISRFEEAIAHEAARLGVDGVVCGHIHTAEARCFGDVAYYNDGDWVEGCTALVEHFDGRKEILHWADEVAARPKPQAARALAGPLEAA